MTIAPENAYKLPQPKGYQCAAGCGHGIFVHRAAGCDVGGCECPAPSGRILPNEDVASDRALPTLYTKFVGGWCDNCAIAAKTKRCPDCGQPMRRAEIEIVPLEEQ